jgi:hypothetical protein
VRDCEQGKNSLRGRPPISLLGRNVPQLIGILTDGIAQENSRPAADFVAPSSPTSFNIPSPSLGEGIIENPVTTADIESPAVRSTAATRIDRQTVVEASPEALSPSRYLDPEAGSITGAFSRELASFYVALLTPVSPAAQLFLQQTLVSSGDLSVLGRMALQDMRVVRGVLATYTPAVPEFFPLYAARVIVARAFNDEPALGQATFEGFPILLHAFQLLATAPRFSLLTLQQLAAYASPVVAALAQVRRHEERFQLLTAVSLLYCNARTHFDTEEEIAACGRYSACRMAALSALHLDLHSDALTLLGTLSDEPLELDTPRQVLTAIALAQSGRFHEAIETAKYFALLPEVMGPLGFDQYADVDDAPYAEILGSIDLDNPEDGYQYEFIDMRLFPAAAHLFQFVRQTLKDTHFDPNDPFTEDIAARRAATYLSRYSAPADVTPVMSDMLH